MGSNEVLDKLGENDDLGAPAEAADAAKVADEAESIAAENDTTTDDAVSATLLGIGFVGQALSPFFLQDPERGSAGASFEAIASLDTQSAGAEWPFVDDARAQECLSLMKEGASGDVSDLGDEYRRLFVGPFKKAAPPWGSVYTDKDSVIFGASTLALRQWMRDNGIRLQTGPAKEPEDHIGLLLAMLPWLVAEKPALVPEFLRDHLLTWASHFLDIVERETSQPFYRGLAQLTKESLNGMREALHIEVKYPRYYR